MIGAIARKIGMSRVFLPTGEAVAVTYVQVDDNTIVRSKNKEKDGYEAVVLGVDEATMKTRKGKEHLQYPNQKEFTVESLEGMAAGGKVTVSTFPVDTLVSVVGISKGKGFQGVMKRHHFAGGPASHGSHFKREPGSVGMRTWPGRIHKNKRMPGHMGSERITIKHRPIIVCDEQQKILAIKGPIPGANGSIVYLTKEVSSAPLATASKKK